MLKVSNQGLGGLSEFIWCGCMVCVVIPDLLNEVIHAEIDYNDVRLRLENHSVLKRFAELLCKLVSIIKCLIRTTMDHR